VVDLSSVFCGKETCLLSNDGRPLLFDSNHPSMDAAMAIAALVYHEMERLGGRKLGAPKLP
jgi:hypothetical protein